MRGLLRSELLPRGRDVEREVQTPLPVVHGREVGVLDGVAHRDGVPARSRPVLDGVTESLDARHPDLIGLVVAVEGHDVHHTLRGPVDHLAEGQRDALGQTAVLRALDRVLRPPRDGAAATAGTAGDEQSDHVVVGGDQVAGPDPATGEPAGLLGVDALADRVAREALATRTAASAAAVVATDRVPAVGDADVVVHAHALVAALIGPAVAIVLALGVVLTDRVHAGPVGAADGVRVLVDRAIAVVVDPVAHLVLADEPRGVAIGAVGGVGITVTIDVAVADIALTVLVEVGLVRVGAVRAVVPEVGDAVAVRVLGRGHLAGAVHAALPHLTVALLVEEALGRRRNAVEVQRVAALAGTAVAVVPALDAVLRRVRNLARRVLHQLVDLAVAVVVEVVVAQLELQALPTVEAAGGALVGLAFHRVGLTPEDVLDREVGIDARGAVVGQDTALLTLVAVVVDVAGDVAGPVVRGALAAVGHPGVLARLGLVAEHREGTTVLRGAGGRGAGVVLADQAVTAVEAVVALDARVVRRADRGARALVVLGAAAGDAHVHAGLVRDAVLGADVVVVARERLATVLTEVAGLVRRAVVVHVAAVRDRIPLAGVVPAHLGGADVTVVLAVDQLALVLGRADLVVAAVVVVATTHADVLVRAEAALAVAVGRALDAGVVAHVTHGRVTAAVRVVVAAALDRALNTLVAVLVENELDAVIRVRIARAIQDLALVLGEVAGLAEVAVVARLAAVLHVHRLAAVVDHLGGGADVVVVLADDGLAQVAVAVAVADGVLATLDHVAVGVVPTAPLGVDAEVPEALGARGAGLGGEVAAGGPVLGDGPVGVAGRREDRHQGDREQVDAGTHRHSPLCT